MKSSTELSEPEQEMLVNWQEPNWSLLSESLAGELKHSAREQKALVRERKLKGALNLLRMVLAYAVCDWSLRLVAAWALIQGIANLSDVALLYRFCQCGAWLGWLVGQVLQQQNALLTQLGGVRLRLVDATVINQPGSKGIDWRVHLSLDLGRMSLDGIEISDVHGAESLARFSPRSDEIYLGDRGYATAGGLGSLLCHGARLLVRTNWHNLRFNTLAGRRLHVTRWIQGLTTTREQMVCLSTPQGSFAMRLIVYPLPSQQAEQARTRVVKKARARGKSVSRATWLSAGYVLLLTNLPSQTWEASRIIYLYRVRWQIELQIKHLKSLLQLDHLRAQDPRLVQTYLLAKLLAALLLEQLVQQAEEQAPELFQSLQRPVSLWRLHALLLIGLRHLITGYISLANILAALPNLQRYVCDAPRTRVQKLAWARRFLARLSGV